MDEEIVESSNYREREMTRYSAFRITPLTLYLGMLGLLIVGVAVYQVRAQLVWLGYFVMVVIALAILLGLAALFFRVRRMRKPVKVVRITDKGVVLVDEFSGKMTTIAPQAPVTPKQGSAAGSLKPATVKIIAPKLADLLAAGILHPGMPQMLIGVRENITPRWGSLEEDVKCVGIGGRGRSGKTNTMFFYVVQYLFQGAEIWLADPHFNKASGLTNMLGPLRKYIRVAGTLDEIQQMFDDLQVEIDERKAQQGPQRPFVIIADEWNGILEDFDIEAEQRGLKEKESYSKVAAALIVKVEREMAGYGMYAALGVHDWMDKALGGTALRRLIHSVLCHRMTADYSKHILEDKTWNSQTQSLRTGHCVFKDNEGIYERLIMPYCQKEDALTVARMLETVVEAAQQPQGAIQPPPKTPELSPLPQKQLGPARSTFINQQQPQSLAEDDDDPYNAPTIEMEAARRVSPKQTGPLAMEATQALNRMQQSVEIEEEVLPKSEDDLHIPEAHKAQYTAADEIEFLKAVNQLRVELPGQKLGRVAILSKIRSNVAKEQGEDAARKWNKKQWPMIAALCDKYGL